MNLIFLNFNKIEIIYPLYFIEWVYGLNVNEIHLTIV